MILYILQTFKLIISLRVNEYSELRCLKDFIVFVTHVNCIQNY